MTLSIFLEILTTIAVTVGAIVAIVGLGEWKKKLKGNTEYDLARRTLIKALKVRDAFQQVRTSSPHMNVKKDDNKDDLIEAEQVIFQKRLDKLDSEWSELYVEILETEAIYGTNKKQIFQPLIECKKELKADVWLYFWLKGAHAKPGATVDDNPKRVQANKEKVFRFYKDLDEDIVTKKLNEAIFKIEEFFRPKLKIK